MWSVSWLACNALCMHRHAAGMPHRCLRAPTGHCTPLRYPYTAPSCPSVPPPCALYAPLHEPVYLVGITYKALVTSDWYHAGAMSMCRQHVPSLPFCVCVLLVRASLMPSYFPEMPLHASTCVLSTPACPSMLLKCRARRFRCGWPVIVDSGSLRVIGPDSHPLPCARILCASVPLISLQPSPLQNPNELDDWLGDINPKSLEVVEGAMASPSLAGAAAGASFQFERLGESTGTRGGSGHCHCTWEEKEEREREVGGDGLGNRGRRIGGMFEEGMNGERCWVRWME